MTKHGCGLVIVALALAACHSDDGNSNDMATGDDLAAVVDLAGDGSLVDLSTNDSNTVEPPDAGEAPTGDGGTNAISCGGMPCDTTSNVCCFTSSTATCEPQSSCTGGVARTCDGPEDCPSGMAICCVKALGATACDSTCTQGLPACHSKDDCPAATSPNQVAACCAISSTLRTCVDVNKNAVPPACN